MGGRKVISVRRTAAADHFAVNLRTACLGVLVLFENQRTGAFADDETVTILIERTRSVHRIVVARRESLHGVETAHAGFIDGSLRTAGDHHVGHTETDGVERIDQTVIRRSARRNRTVVGAHETIFDGDVARRDVGDHARNKEWAKPRSSISCGVAQTLIEERLKSSDTGTPDHTDLLQVLLLEIESRILDSLRGRDEGILGEEVVFTHLLTVEMLRPVVIFYFTSELRLKFLGIKMSNRRGAANSFFEIGKKLCNIIAERVDGTDTRHDYSSFCHKFKALRFAGWKNRKLFLVCLDIGDSVANGSDLLCILVRDLDIESLLKFHDQLNGVE